MKVWTGFTVLALMMGSCAAAMAAAQAPAPADPGQAPPPAQAGAGGTAAGRGGRGGAPQGGGGGAYPQHAQADPDTINRGKDLYNANCASCHGPDARGSQTGTNLLRSELVMDDQTGEGIAPVVQQGRADQGMPKFELSKQQITDIAGFIHSFRVAGYDTSRNVPRSIVVGDAAAGEAFFNGAGKCSTCHSVSGDLAGIGTRRDPKSLQNAIVSGGGGGRGGAGGGTPTPPTTVTVTQANGKVYEGKLTRIDDFLVTLTDDSGIRMSFTRDGDVPKVVVHNPLQAHIDMLRNWKDDDIHNLTAYLVTVK